MLFPQEQTSSNMNNFQVQYVNMGPTSNDIRTFEVHSFNRGKLQMIQVLLKLINLTGANFK